MPCLCELCDGRPRDKTRQSGLGAEFVGEVIKAWHALADNPLLSCRRHPTKNIRWRYPDRFPYRIIYEVSEDEHTVLVAAVLHAARHDRHWQQRLASKSPAP